MTFGGTLYRRLFHSEKGKRWWFLVFLQWVDLGFSVGGVWLRLKATIMVALVAMTILITKLFSYDYFVGLILYLITKLLILLRNFALNACKAGGITFDKAMYNSFINLQDKLHKNICGKNGGNG